MNLDIKDHISQAISKGIRMDGRGLDEFRPLKVETKVTSTAEGSARVTCGDSVVVCGVKLALEKPYPDTPDNGNLMVNAELLPLSNPRFEPGPPPVEGIEISRVIDRSIREGKAIDTKKLCVKAGEQVWSVSIDVCPINLDGNLIDLGALAAMAALQTATFPEVKKDGKPDYHARTTKKLPLNDVPLPVTVWKVGSTFIVDATEEEESAADCRLTVAFTKDGHLCAMQKNGGPLTLDEIKAIIALAKKANAKLREALGGAK